jgi:hypothetical protein
VLDFLRRRKALQRTVFGICVENCTLQGLVPVRGALVRRISAESLSGLAQLWLAVPLGLYVANDERGCGR